MPGTSKTKCAVREAHDVHFVLADAYCFDEDELVSGGVQNQRHIARRPRQAPEKSARRHRTDENARVGGVALHAYAVAENCSARIGTRRIDRNNPHADSPALDTGQPDDRLACSSPFRARLSLQSQRNFRCRGKICCKSSSACGSRSSIAVIARETARTSPARICSAHVSMDADIVWWRRRPAGKFTSRTNSSQKSRRERRQLLRTRALLPARAWAANSVSWLKNPDWSRSKKVITTRQGPHTKTNQRASRIWRAITMRWISLVPSPIVQSLESR